MNEVMINIDDYLSEGDKLEIARDEFRSKISVLLNKDVERIFNNAAYHMIFNMVDEVIDGDSKEAIKNKVIEIFNDLSEFSVLRKKDVWDRNESPGYSLLVEACQENKHVLQDRVKRIMSELDETRLKDYLYEIICEVVEDRLIKKAQTSD